jgi:inner membrane protein
MKLGSGPVLKGLMVMLVALVVLIPVQMLRDLIEERARSRQEAVTSVARGWGGEQLIGGPVLAIPVSTPAANVDWFVLPESLTLESELRVLDERRKLGVYEVPVYVTNVHARAIFDIESRIAALMQSQSGAVVHLDRARLIVPISDSRGVREIHLTGVGVSDGAFEPDREFATSALGVALRLDAQIEKGSHAFDLTMQVAGTHSLSFMPTARSSTVQLSGNWPDPGFSRGFLPVERSVRDGRFNAKWQILDVNRAFGGAWLGRGVAAPALQDSAFGVDLVQPVDLYQQAERSVKYAGLFIALSLLTLFVWEHLARRPLHPIQYALMGLALSVFYLLLLAGSLAVFALLAAAMVLTRRLDWYQATARPQQG